MRPFELLHQPKYEVESLLQGKIQSYFKIENWYPHKNYRSLSNTLNRRWWVVNILIWCLWRDKFNLRFSYYFILYIRCNGFGPTAFLYRELILKHFIGLIPLPTQNNTT